MKSTLLILACLTLLPACSSAKFPDKQAKSMRLTIGIDQHGTLRKTPLILDIVDPKCVAEVVSVLSIGTENRDHKCLSAGRLQLAYQDGSEVEVAILPGHHREYYEFRQGGTNYRVPRDALLDAFKKGGIDISLIPQGREDER